jgi:cytochrome b
VTLRERVRVWDLAVRWLHAGLIVGIAAAWTTTEWMTRWHQAIGYGVMAIVALRLVWGVVGSRHARFSQFVRSPRQTLAYAFAVLQRSDRRYIGHNPLGGWMVVALLGCIGATAFTGWLFTTDQFWGDERVENLHHRLAWCVLGLIALHVLGVLYTSLHHRENLAAAMVDGRKPAPQEHDIA